MTDLDFTRFLTGHGLTVAGSMETIQDLKLRYGVRRWFDFLDVIDLPPASLFPEQTERFFLRMYGTCLLPPSELECDFDYYRDGPRTHACARERLTALFGVPEKGAAVNTLSETWKFERMSLRILTFLREKTRPGSPLYARHPELWNFCRISIDRNWVRPATKEDGEALDSLDANQTLPIELGHWRKMEPLSPWERGLFRLSAGGGPDAPFLWRQRPSVGWRAAPWSAIFERRLCTELTLDQVEAARGPAYSRLILTLRNPFSFEQEPVETVLLTGADMHTLDLVAPEVSAFWGLPIKIREYPNE
jgi:hypothetical protein